MNHKGFTFVSWAILTAGLATAASAADLAVSAPVYKAPVVMPVFSWTGCYLGVEGGGVWGNSKHTSADPAFSPGASITNELKLSGGLAGGTAGCNYQFGTWVLGLENDISWTDARGGGNDISPFNTNASSHTNEKWLDTLRGRVGYAWDRVLLYGTGGVAFANAGVTVNGVTATVNESRTLTGWAAGAGIEYAPWNHVTLKLEYLHADFGSSTFINPDVTVGGHTIVTRDVTLTNDIVRAGVNYKF